MFDNLKNKAMDLAKDNADKIEQAAEVAIEKAGDAVDAATGHKFADKVDLVQEKAPEQIAKLLGDAKE